MTFRDTIEKYYLSDSDAEKEKAIMELNDIVLEKLKDIEHNALEISEVFIKRERICLIFESEKRQEIIYVQIYEDFTTEQIEYDARQEKVDDGSLVLDTTVCMREVTDVSEIIGNIIEYLTT